MKSKKWLLLLIIAFPSLFWLILELSTINSRKLPFYGPKSYTSDKDTSYYSVNRQFHAQSDDGFSNSPDFRTEGSFVLAILHPSYRTEAYRLDGFWEYLNYKASKIAGIPFYFLCPISDSPDIAQELNKLKKSPNIHFVGWPYNSYDSLRAHYFKEKPYYTDSSFFLLIDANDHLRGYYDIRYASEMKRLIEEYQHLRLKEEKQKLLNDNEIKDHS